ncbi:MAG: shikimate dehydrogenase [Myxococcota bacterium]
MIHAAALAATGQRGDYTLLDVPPSLLAAAVNQIRSGALHGMNATIPHKGAVASLCDRLVGAAETLGVANTLTLAPDGALEGHNTDVAGLEHAIHEAFPTGPFKGRPVAVIGAGGAGYASVLAAARLNPSNIRVTNRTLSRAITLQEHLSDAVGCQLKVVDSIVEAVEGAALVIQATSSGMSTAERSPAWLGLMQGVSRYLQRTAPDACVIDLVYRPGLTPWVAAANVNQRRAANGLSMLVHQAAQAFEIWTGQLPPSAPLREAALAALRAG